SGDRQTISIPATLLISALGQVPDVATCVTMDLKKAGNQLFQIGVTGDHFGGSHWAMVNDLTGGNVPTVDPERAKTTFAALHQAISGGLVRSCHDLSEGGLAVAIAEMAFAGGLGAEVSTDEVGIEMPEVAPDAEVSIDYAAAALLFSESNTRFVVEIETDKVDQFIVTMGEIDVQRIGQVIEEPKLTIEMAHNVIIESDLARLKLAWQGTLDWA
ncbi:MAG: phosphoribosylformylglycinamidine (FGAM) synthase-like enzyme, partial [Mariniblastus sp.]